MVKIVTLFLIGMVVLAMFGRVWLPGLGMRRVGKCKRCGKFQIGREPCDCRIGKG